IGWFCSGTAVAAELVIRVIGLRSGAGTVQFAIYDAPEHFPTRNGRVAKGGAPATEAGTIIRVPALKAGTYAVAVFHDENDNDSFDQNFFGLPLEDYGFSNDARGFLGPPSFDAAAFP